MSNKKKNKPSPAPQEVLRPVDIYFKELSAIFANPQNRGLYAVFLTLFFFGLMGLIWMIPFPQFDFMVKMGWHTFLNWGSIFIAIIVYSYLRLAPTLSYAMLIEIGVMSFFIVQLEYLERAGGPAVWLVTGLIMLVSLAALIAISKREAVTVSTNNLIRLITIGPIWFWSFVFKKLKLKF
ncbi:hypothetical protein [Sphingobacterium spiritivorum]|uniref:hypothetical protein n=1 Tax=Sphingobacterium spiritivorum TaxID=258 RepID=UPI003DA3A63D